MNIIASPTVCVLGQPCGSASGVWLDGSNHKYLLTAAHVLSPFPPFSATQWVSASGETGGGQTLDGTFNWTTTNGGLLDAGLIAIQDEGPFGSESSYPWGTPPAASPPSGSVVICGMNGPVFATFTGWEPPGVKFDGDTRPHGRLMKFSYDSGATRPGDSGGAVIALPEGTIVGVHVGEQTKTQTAWAVYIEDIVDNFAPLLPGFRPRP